MMDTDALIERLRGLLAKKAATLPWQRVTDLPALAIKGANRSTIVQTPNQNAWNRFGTANAWDGVNGEDTCKLIVEAINALPSLLARIEAAEKVIEPFAKAEITGWRSAKPGTERIPYEIDGLTDADFRAAAQWQAGQEGEG